MHNFAEPLHIPFSLLPPAPSLKSRFAGAIKKLVNVFSPQQKESSEHRSHAYKYRNLQPYTCIQMYWHGTNWTSKHMYKIQGIDMFCARGVNGGGPIPR